NSRCGLIRNTSVPPRERKSSKSRPSLVPRLSGSSSFGPRQHIEANVHLYKGHLCLYRIFAMDCPISSFWITGQMAKPKKTDIVKLQLRIRELLRRKLELAASGEARSLNSEIARRLENSFDQDKNSHVLEALLAPGAGLELVRYVGTILKHAGRDWYRPPKS